MLSRKTSYPVARRPEASAWEWKHRSATPTDGDTDRRKTAKRAGLRPRDAGGREPRRPDRQPGGDGGAAGAHRRGDRTVLGRAAGLAGHPHLLRDADPVRLW